MARQARTGNLGSSDNHTPHCESCGQENPHTDEDGYTTCCNQLVCYGLMNEYASLDRFGNETVWAEACCWAEADKVFKAAGVKVVSGMSRLS